MKKVSTIVLGLVLASAALFMSCDNPFRPSLDAEGTDPGKGTVRIVVGGDLARTVIPASGQFTDIKYFLKAGEADNETAYDTLQVQDEPYTLATGKWTIKVEAYTGDTISAEGVKTFTVEKGSVTVTVKLAGRQAGSGTFAYAIQYPGAYNLKVILKKGNTVYPLSGGTLVTEGDTKIQSLTKSDVPSGFYTLLAGLLDESGTSVAGTREAVHIYDNMVSSFGTPEKAIEFALDGAVSGEVSTDTELLGVHSGDTELEPGTGGVYVLSAGEEDESAVIGIDIPETAAVKFRTGDTSGLNVVNTGNGIYTVNGLAPGDNEIFIIITAGDEVTKAEYLLIINRETSYGIRLEPTVISKTWDAVFDNDTQEAEKYLVTVVNTGNEPTGDLKVEFTGEGGAFELSNTSIGSIEPASSAFFEVWPKTGEALGEGLYTDVVSVSRVDGNVLLASKSLVVNITVKEALWGISLSQGEKDFGSIYHNETVPGPQSVTVTNTGNQPYGDLTVALNDGESSAFDVTQVVNGAFTVAPKADFEPKDLVYTDTVKVTGDHGISASFPVKFEVKKATWDISLDLTGITFADLDFNYSSVVPKTVKVTNRGNQATGNLSVTAGQDGTSLFEVVPETITSIAVGESRDFSVKPKFGLELGTHEADITVSGTDFTQTVQVSVKVVKVPVTSVTITGEPPVLFVDETTTLTAVVEPGNATFRTVTWESSNIEVATVNSSNGVVTAVKAGMATITASADGVESSVTVTVKDRTGTGSVNLVWLDDLLKASNVVFNEEVSVDELLEISIPEESPLAGEGYTYIWRIRGEEVGTESSYTFDPGDKIPGEVYTITLIIETPDPDGAYYSAVIYVTVKNN
jgi:hypothetical protein